jgi:hypothetical protein
LFVAFSLNGAPIRLTEERMKHIFSRHPEVQNNTQKILETISNPEIIQEGDFGVLLAIRRYEDKYLVVVYKELSKEDGFVLTAYYARYLNRKRKVILWR